jgi:hypothetical protein
LLHYSSGTWTAVTPPAVSSACSLFAVHFTSPNEGWAVGKDYNKSKGVLLHYSNGIWTSEKVPDVSSDLSLFGVFFSSADQGWVVGTDSTNGRGVLFKYDKLNKNIGIYRNGAWYLDKTLDGGWNGCEADECISSFGGLSIDIPVMEDWTGDGNRRLGIYRQGYWYLDFNGSGTWNGCGTDGCLGPFGGLSIDLPIVGDWTGDGVGKIGIYRKGMWYLDLDNSGTWSGSEVDGCLGPFGGTSIDIPVAGDWTGDGKAKIGIYRQGYWYLDKNGNGNWDGCDVDGCLGPFGGYEKDKPVVGDWNGNGLVKIGIYREGRWYLDRDGNGTWDGCVIDACLGPFWGFYSDIPIIK